jgi:hypothetical protein
MKDKYAICGASALATILLLSGFVAGYNTKRSVVMHGVQDTIDESIKTGKPFSVIDGRMALIEKTHYASNGKTIAYRVLSFTYPEE